jgi:hypothetical protein
MLASAGAQLLTRRVKGHPSHLHRIVCRPIGLVLELTSKMAAANVNGHPLG